MQWINKFDHKWIEWSYGCCRFKLTSSKERQSKHFPICTEILYFRFYHSFFSCCYFYLVFANLTTWMTYDSIVCAHKCPTVHAHFTLYRIHTFTFIRHAFHEFIYLTGVKTANKFPPSIHFTTIDVRSKKTDSALFYMTALYLIA